jgi:hypothetical protein
MEAEEVATVKEVVQPEQVAAAFQRAEVDSQAEGVQVGAVAVVEMVVETMVPVAVVPAAVAAQGVPGGLAAALDRAEADLVDQVLALDRVGKGKGAAAAAVLQVEVEAVCLEVVEAILRGCNSPLPYSRWYRCLNPPQADAAAVKGRAADQALAVVKAVVPVKAVAALAEVDEETMDPALVWEVVPATVADEATALGVATTAPAVVTVPAVVTAAEAMAVVEGEDLVAAAAEAALPAEATQVGAVLAAEVNRR